MNDIVASRTVVLYSLTVVAIGACGENRGATLDTGDDAQSSNDAAASDALGQPASASDDATAPASGQVFMSGDASVTPSSDCKPGTYSGPYVTDVILGDAAPTALSLQWKGTLTVTLVGMTQTTNAGELPTTTLTIAPGGRMDGTDMFHGSFGADVVGQLDCPSRTLQATIQNGVYELLNDAGTLPFTGTVDGTYNATMPPALNGSINVATSPGLFGALGATGMVTATLRWRPGGVESHRRARGRDARPQALVSEVRRAVLRALVDPARARADAG